MDNHAVCIQFRYIYIRIAILLDIKKFYLSQKPSNFQVDCKDFLLQLQNQMSLIINWITLLIMTNHRYGPFRTCFDTDP